MKLEHSDEIPESVATVYSLVKNQLCDLAQYFPSVDRIEKLSEEKISENDTKIVNHWFAKMDMPYLVKKVVSKDLLTWKDVAHWDDKKMQVTYELESFVANDLFEAKGINQFFDRGKSKMELRVSCEVKINPEKIPGIPKLMVKKVVPVIEKIIEAMLKPNITSLGQGIKSYLADQ